MAEQRVRVTLGISMDYPTQGLNTVIYRSARSQLLSILFLFLLIIAAIYATTQYEWAIQPLSLGEFGGRSFVVFLPLFGLLPLAWFAKILHSLLNFRYILCDEYVLEVRGLWALRRKSIRLNYVHIRGVEISESIWQQLLGIGDIEILSDISMAADPQVAAEHTILMEGVANPRRIKNTVQERVQAHVQNAKLNAVDV